MQHFTLRVGMPELGTSIGPALAGHTSGQRHADSCDAKNLGTPTKRSIVVKRERRL